MEIDMEEPTTLMSQLRLSMDDHNDKMSDNKDPREMSLKESMAPLLPPLPPPPPAEDATSHTLKTQLKQRLNNENNPEQHDNRHLEDTNDTDSGSENQDYDKDALQEWQDTANGEDESAAATAAMTADALRQTLEKLLDP